MSTTYTPRAALGKPATIDRNWDVPLNANADALDAVNAIGALAVTPTELPSASLRVRVAGGTFINASGIYTAFGGSASLTLPASATTNVWLSDSGVLSSGPSWPAAGTNHVRLATVTTNITAVASINDQRAVLRSASS